MNSWFIISSLLISSILIFGVQSHNWLDTPVSRNNQRESQTGCRVGGEGSPNCPGPCDKSVSGITIAPVAASRGTSLQIKWNRHTHPGGFIRFAWSPTSQSDSASSFDSGVDRIVCKEIGGCGPSDPSQPSSTTNGNLCQTTIQVPEWVTDGAWTLQWAYFGGWYNAGDYYACVDYTISGGPSSSKTSPVFVGSDYTYPNTNECLFYSTNALHVCVVEPCTTGTFPAGDQHGPAAGFSSSPPPPPPPSATTGKITTGPRQVTTGITSQHVITTASRPVTTALHPVTTASRPVTTAALHPVTTAAQPVSTGARAITTGSKSITSGSHASQVTTGVMNQVTTGITSDDANALCYLPGTPFLDGPINSNPPTCGSNSSPQARCAEGLCCSQYGYCGPIADSKGRYFEEVHGRYVQVSAEHAFGLYCNSKSQADYRKVPCNGLNDLNKDAGSASLLRIQVEIILVILLVFLFLF